MAKKQIRTSRMSSRVCYQQRWMVTKWIYSKPSFLRLTSKQVHALISRDVLPVSSEISVYKAVMYWIRHDPEKRMKYIGSLFDEVRFAFIPTSYMTEVFKKDLLVESYVDHKRLFLGSTSYQLQTPRTRGDLEFKYINTTPRVTHLTPQALYIFGASGNGRSHVEKYDFDENTWTTLDADIPYTRSGIATFKRRLWFVGGTCERARTQSAVHSFGSVEPVWRAERPMNEARKEHGVVVHGEKLFTVGGNSDNDVLDTVEFYSKTADGWRWSKCREKMNKKRANHGVAASALKVFAAGGVNSRGKAHRTIEHYCVKSGLWTIIAPFLKGARKRCCALNWEGWIFLLGGDTQGKFEIYNDDGKSNSNFKTKLLHPSQQSKTRLIAEAGLYNRHLYIVTQIEDQSSDCRLRCFEPFKEGLKNLARPSNDLKMEFATAVVYDKKIPSFKNSPTGSAALSKIQPVAVRDQSNPIRPPTQSESVARYYTLNLGSLPVNKGHERPQPSHRDGSSKQPQIAMHASGTSAPVRFSGYDEQPRILPGSQISGSMEYWPQQSSERGSCPSISNDDEPSTSQQPTTSQYHPSYYPGGRQATSEYDWTSTSQQPTTSPYHPSYYPGGRQATSEYDPTSTIQHPTISKQPPKRRHSPHSSPENDQTNRRFTKITPQKRPRYSRDLSTHIITSQFAGSSEMVTSIHSEDHFHSYQQSAEQHLIRRTETSRDSSQSCLDNSASQQPDPITAPVVFSGDAVWSSDWGDSADQRENLPEQHIQPISVFSQPDADDQDELE